MSLRLALLSAAAVMLLGLAGCTYHDYHRGYDHGYRPGYGHHKATYYHVDVERRKHRPYWKHKRHYHRRHHPRHHRRHYRHYDRYDRYCD